MCNGGKVYTQRRNMQIADFDRIRTASAMGRARTQIDQIWMSDSVVGT